MFANIYLLCCSRVLVKIVSQHLNFMEKNSFTTLNCTSRVSGRNKLPALISARRSTGTHLRTLTLGAPAQAQALQRLTCIIDYVIRLPIAFSNVYYNPYYCTMYNFHRWLTRSRSAAAASRCWYEREPSRSRARTPPLCPTALPTTPPPLVVRTCDTCTDKYKTLKGVIYSS